MKINRTLIIILILLLATGVGLAVFFSNQKEPPTSCPEGQWSASGDFTDCKECTQCLLPKVVGQECTQTSDTICKDPAPTSCPEGQWSASGEFTDCKDCSTCVSPQIVDQACTERTDTICKNTSCPEGQWSASGEFNDCQACSTCVSPQIVDQNCTQTSDTTCKDPAPTSCPEGQWSASGDFTDCQACSTCVSPQIVDQACTQITDTTCKDDPSKYTYETVNFALGSEIYGGAPIVATSKDGVNWTNNPSNYQGSNSDLLWWDETKLWVSVGGQGISTSEDGTNWSLVPGIHDDKSGGSYGLACDGNMCIVGYNYTSKVKKFATSVDGINWSFNEADGPLYWCSRIETGNGLWVAGGTSDYANMDLIANTLAYSEDGANWVGLGKDIFPFGCTDLKYNGSIWVAQGCAVDDSSDYTKCSTAYSKDGKTWTKSNINDVQGSLFIPSCLDWNGREWLAFPGDGKFYSSTDGMNWTSISVYSGNYFPIQLFWDDSKWIMIGNTYMGLGVGESYISTSPDGITWEHKQIDDYYYNAIAKGKIPISSNENYFVSYAVRGPMAAPNYNYGPSPCDRDPRWGPKSGIY